MTKALNVLSLFDGIACGRVALEQAGIGVNKYFASEIDMYPMKVAKKNYPDIIQLGDVRKVKYEQGVLSSCGDKFNTKIDLVIGGSPCQGFSYMGNQLNFDDPRSVLFFEYVRLLNAVRETNPDVKFLLENVNLNEESKKIISAELGVEPVKINSSVFTAQNRPRLYWTNIEFSDYMEDREIYLKDIIEQDYDECHLIKDGRLKWLNEHGPKKLKQGYIAINPDKAKCLTLRSEESWNTTYWDHGGGKIRRLTPTECEVLQSLPKGYTKHISDYQRYRALGNCWTVSVIEHIFKGLR